MSWENVIKNSDNFWRPKNNSLSLCGCLSERPSRPLTSNPDLYYIEQPISHHWTQQDDIKLCHLAEKYNYDWDTIACKFDDKTPGQLRRRWELKLNPSIKLDDWEEVEENLLRELVLTNGYDWEAVSAHFKKRKVSDLVKRFNSHILPKLTQSELAALQDITSPRVQSTMEIESSINESNMSALQRKVQELEGNLKETMDKIEKLESELCESSGLMG